VSEGLADNFATSLYPDALQPATHALSGRQEHRLWQRAQQHLYEVLWGARHDHWMFGGGGFPQWTGYTLGHDLVLAAHRLRPRSWARFTRMPAEDILRLSRFNP
jgi:uncharacterized protein YjaZ